MRFKSRIFFLGGIHAVGKGTLCKRISSMINIESVSASELIKWNEINKDPLNKSVKDIPSTQERLLQGLNHFCERHGTFILDGHFSLLNRDNIPTRVPEEIFMEIKPFKMFLLKASPNTIKMRLENRDKKVYDIRLIEELQESEITYAQYLSNKINCELKIFTSRETESIIMNLKQLI